MADQLPTPKRPSPAEFAKSRQIGVPVGGRFVELLQPTDSVLIAKGGKDLKIYRETLRDDQCAATFNDRRLAVTSKEWVVDAASEDPLDVAAADFIREELTRIGWDSVTDKMLYARWYGHSVAECLYRIDGNLVRLDKIKVRDRGRFLYDTEGGIWLLGDRGQWEPMPERKFWHVAVGADNDDEPYGLGLAHYCYWPVFFKRNGLKFWLVFIEKFGAPTAIGKVPGGKWDDEALKEAVLEALLQFSTEAAIVVPEETTVELLEATRSGTATYGDLYDKMDAALAKLIIGQTASSQGTPGRLGNEELQAEVRSDLVKADADLITDSFNRQVCAWLTEWNFPGAKPPRVWRKVEPEEDLGKAAATDKAIKELGFQPSEEYIKQRYGEHWEKAEPLNLGAGGSFAAQPGPIGAAADFAELGAVAILKAGKRADQQSMKEAAEFLANRGGLVGARVAQILAYSQGEGVDYADMAGELQRLAQQLPDNDGVLEMRNATFFARLLARFRGNA